MRYLLSVLILCSVAQSASQTDCVPVMGLGAVVDPLHFVPRLITSVDYCVENFVIVVTSFSLDNITSSSVPLLKNSSYIRNFTIVIREKYIFSVSEGWNTILHTFPQAKWYIIIAYDILLRPGQLEKMSRRFWDESGYHFQRNISTILAFSNYDNADVRSCAYNMFAVKRDVFQNIGIFDENLFPVRFLIYLYYFHLS